MPGVVAALAADGATWLAMASDVRGGKAAFRAGRLRVRGNLIWASAPSPPRAQTSGPERLGRAFSTSSMTAPRC
jgi:hypothetical protein